MDTSGNERARLSWPMVESCRQRLSTHPFVDGVTKASVLLSYYWEK